MAFIVKKCSYVDGPGEWSRFSFDATGGDVIRPGRYPGFSSAVRNDGAFRGESAFLLAELVNRVSKAGVALKIPFHISIIQE